MYKVGEKVDCKHGAGVITYYEDDYLEIQMIDNGAERSFFAPFEGKVWEHDPNKPDKKQEFYDKILEHPAVNKHISIAKINMDAMAFMKDLVGLQQKRWEELDSYQKLSHLTTIHSIPFAIWTDAVLSKNKSKIIREFEKNKT